MANEDHSFLRNGFFILINSIYNISIFAGEKFIKY